MTSEEERAFEAELNQLMAELEQYSEDRDGEDWFVENWHPRYMRIIIRRKRAREGLSAQSVQS